MRIQMWRLRRRPKPARILLARRRRPLTRGQRIAVKAAAVLAVVLLVMIISSARVMPIVTSLARSEAREVVIRAVNAAVEEELENGWLDYNRLVTLEKDENGGITALVTNSALINVLQTRISENIVDNADNLVDTNMSIPIGTAVGGVLFSGRGPRIPVKIQSVTNVQTRFTNDFSSAGINQTRHKIMLEISAEIDIILPGGKERANVTTELAIAETVIVGVVPNVYADIGRMLE